MVSLTQLTQQITGFYFIMFPSEAYILQNNTTIDRQIITAGKLFVKAQYMWSTPLTSLYHSDDTQNTSYTT